MTNSTTGISGLYGLLAQATDFTNRLIPFIIGLTVLFFLWGIFRLVFSAKDSEARTEARGYIIWGIIALAVMVSVWGLVNLLTSTFSLNQNIPSGPGLPQAGGSIQLK
ncbi:MAG: hypothetical protein WCQ00_03590 [bacterium]